MWRAIEQVLFVVVMGAAILGVLTMVTYGVDLSKKAQAQDISACQVRAHLPTTEKPDDRIRVPEMTTGLMRAMDPELRVACYAFNGNGISCVRLDADYMEKIPAIPSVGK